MCCPKIVKVIGSALDLGDDVVSGIGTVLTTKMADATIPLDDFPR